MFKKLMQFGILVVVATSLIAPLLNTNNIVHAAEEEDIFTPLSMDEISIKFLSRTTAEVKFPNKPAFNNGAGITYDELLSDTYLDTSIDGRFSWVSTTGGLCDYSDEKKPELLLGTADSKALTNDGNANGLWLDLPEWDVAHFNSVDLIEVCINGDSNAGLTMDYELRGDSGGLVWEAADIGVGGLPAGATGITRRITGTATDYAIVDWNYINQSLIFEEGSGGNACLNALDGSLALCSTGSDSETFINGDMTINVPVRLARTVGPETATFSPATRTDKIGFFGGRSDPADLGLASGATGENAETCESTGGGMGWLICGILGVVDNTIGFIINSFIIDGLGLEFKQHDLPGIAPEGANQVTQQSYDNTYALWSTFRVIANVMFVIGFLVMIFGQTLGIDAYMIKKMAPRIAIAAILVQLSWVLSIEVLHWVNIIGGGIDNLLFAPFGGNVPDPPFLGGKEGIGFALFGGVVIGAAMGLIGALALGSVIALSLLGSFATVIFRNILLFILLILSPVAAVLWILPNTDKYAKLWWSWFIKALLVYPMIVGLIAIGKIASTISVVDGGALGSIIGVAVYFAPYFMIPFVFKFAGGAIAATSGYAQGIAKTAGARTKEWEKPRTAERRQIARSGKLYKNKFASGIAAGLTRAPLDTVGRVTGTSLGGKARSRVATATMASYQEAAKQLQVDGISNDKVLNYMAEQTRSVADMEKQAQSWEGKGMHEEAAQLRVAKKHAGKASSAVGALLLNQSYGFASDEAVAGINNTVEDAGVRGQLFNYGGSLAKKSGRPDQGPNMFSLDKNGMVEIEDAYTNSAGDRITYDAYRELKPADRGRILIGQGGAKADRSKLPISLKSSEFSNQKPASLKASRKAYTDILRGNSTSVFKGKSAQEKQTIIDQTAQRLNSSLGEYSNTDVESQAIIKEILESSGHLVPPRRPTGPPPPDGEPPSTDDPFGGDSGDGGGGL